MKIKLPHIGFGREREMSSEIIDRRSRADRVVDVEKVNLDDLLVGFYVSLGEVRTHDGWLKELRDVRPDKTPEERESICIKIEEKFAKRSAGDNGANGQPLP